MRSPFIVDITPHKRASGVQRPLVAELEPSEGMCLDTAEIVTSALHVDFLLEIAGEHLVAAGRIDAHWHGPCRRCLEPVTGVSSFKVQEIFEQVPVEGETYLLDKDEVDLEPMLREAVLLNVPVVPLCSDDCLGPDPDRFPASVEVDDPDDSDSSGSDAQPVPRAGDPRWAALDALQFGD